MTDDITALVNLLTQAGALVLLASISYSNYRQERTRVREIQEARVKEQAELYEKRIEDQRRWIDTLTSILTARGVYQSEMIRTNNKIPTGLEP